MCGDVVLAIYGPETLSVDETPTQPTAMSVTQAASTATDSRIITSTVTKSVDHNVPEIIVNN